MGIYSWDLPSPGGGGSGGSGSIGGVSSTPGGPLVGGSGFDLAVDPDTRDFIDTDDGVWLETNDQRTAMLFQFESTYQAWWGDPDSGSRVREIMADLDQGGPDALVDDMLRAGQMIVDAGEIEDLAIRLPTDDEVTPIEGRTTALVGYAPRSGGAPVDLAYVPFGGR